MHIWLLLEIKQIAWKTLTIHAEMRWQRVKVPSETHPPCRAPPRETAGFTGI